MELTSKNIELLLDDLKRAAALLEDAAVDAELLDSQPYQEARLLELRRQVFAISEQLQQLRRELARPQQQSTGRLAEIEPSMFVVGA